MRLLVSTRVRKPLGIIIHGWKPTKYALECMCQIPPNIGILINIRILYIIFVILQCRNIWNILQWWEGIAKLSGIWNVTELQYIFLELSFNEKWRDLEIYDVGKTSIFKSCLKQPYGTGNLHFCRISSHEQHPKPAKSHCTLVPKRIYILWRILFVVFPTKPRSYVDNPKNGTPTKKRQHTFTS